jgi:hypothetical protein
MKYKTLFRLVLKAIGVLLIGLGLPGFGGSLASISYQLWSASQPGAAPLATSYWWSQFYLFAGPLLQLIFGLYLLLGGKWILEKCIPSNKTYCSHCSYELSDASAQKCSECGAALATDA